MWAPPCSREIGGCSSFGNFCSFFLALVEPSEAEIEFVVAPFPLQHLRAGQQLVQGAVSSAARLQTEDAL